MYATQLSPLCVVSFHLHDPYAKHTNLISVLGTCCSLIVLKVCKHINDILEFIEPCRSLLATYLTSELASPSGLICHRKYVLCANRHPLGSANEHTCMHKRINKCALMSYTSTHT